MSMVDDEISVPVNLPLDSDYFLRRECPACKQEFKWFSHPAGDESVEQVDQYFCPRCGTPGGTASWWTPAQLEYARNVAMPNIVEHMDGLLRQAFGGISGGVLSFDFQSTGEDLPLASQLFEPDDMLIVQPPCHPNEPIKVPETATARIHCLICGAPFAA